MNLALTTLKFPAMAIVSILHRLSGVLLFLLMPVMLYFLSLSLDNIQSFAQLQTMFAKPYVKILLFAFASAWVLHLIAGIRHLLMDLGWGEQVASGRKSAIFSMGLAALGIILLGVWLW